MCFFFLPFFPAFVFFNFFVALEKKNPLHNKQNKKQNCNRWKNKTQKRFDRFAFIGRRRRRSRSASSRAPAPSFAAIGRPGQLGTGQSNLWMIFFLLFFHSSSFLLFKRPTKKCLSFFYFSLSPPTKIFP